MKVLATAELLNSELVRLIEECVSCQLAVAWASVGFDAFDLLVKSSEKIEKMVVGTHFFQTHPAFMETFLTHPKVRFVMKTDGVFHPKVYFFEKANGEWECLVGSPNLTSGGFRSNDEMAVLLTDQDDGAQDAFEGIKASIVCCWQKGKRFTLTELAAYRDTWRRKQSALKHLGGKFGNPHEEESDDGGKAPLSVPILCMPWAVYFEKVKTEKTTPYGHSMQSRLQVIRAARRLFAERQQFNKVDVLGRKRIAGLLRPSTADAVDYRMFGSMTGVGMFQKAVNDNDEHLSLALDVIPFAGGVSREVYLQYIEQYKKAFPNGRHGVPTATRLLAMKRPDTFVCLNRKNRERLCGEFGIRPRVNYEQYWDSIIERIVKEAAWWCAPSPQDAVEREVWEARAAFLDSHYYAD